jgi:hypothetical protein
MTKATEQRKLAATMFYRYGGYRALSPREDPLRKDPRFQKLVGQTESK